MTGVAGSAARDARAAVPAWWLRIALGVLLLALAGLHALDAWGWIAALAAIGALVSPWVQLAWVAMLSLALGELAGKPGAASWHPYVVLAGIALAQLLAARVALTAPGARVALGVFAGPLRTTALIVAPCEVLLAVALRLDAAPHDSWLPAVLLAVLALLGLGVLLFGRLLRAER